MIRELAFSMKAMTLSLSVLVAIEMFNSLNALSEDVSLLSMPPWVNPYVSVLAQVFGIVPFSFNEWLLVLAVAFPVILYVPVLAQVFGIVPLSFNKCLSLF